jgi:hypothetical protein
MIDPMQQAREAGYSDEEINDYLGKVEQAKLEGYSDAEISQFTGGQKVDIPENVFETPEEENQGLFPQIARKGAILATGLAKAHPYAIGYDVGSAAFNLAQEGRGRGGLIDKIFPLEERVPTVTPGAGILPEVPPEIAPKEQERFKLPSSSELAIEAGNAIGVNLNPETTFEKILDLGGLVHGLGKKALNKTLSLLGKEERAYEIGKSLTNDAVLATTAVGMNEVFGTPEIATLLSGGLAIPTLGKVAKGAGQLARNYTLFDPRNIFTKNPVEAFKQEAKKAKANALSDFEKGVISAEKYEIAKPHLDIAEEYGIPINVGSFTDSQHYKSLEKLISSHPLSQEAKNTFLQKSAENWANAQYKLTRQLSGQKLFSDKNSVAESLFNDVTKKRHQELKNEASTLYSAAEKGFENAEPISVEDRDRLIKSFNKVADKLSSSFVNAPVESQTKNIARESAGTLAQKKQKLINTLDKEGNVFNMEGDKITFAKDVKPNDLIATIKSLNDVTLWDQPSVKNLLNGPRNEIKSVLGQYKNKSPEAYAAYTEANAKYAEQAKLFGKGNKWEKWGIYSESTPEDLIRTTNSVSKFNQFKRDFGGSEQGKLLIDEMKRLHVEEKLSPFFEQVDYSPGKIAQGVKKLNRDPLFLSMLDKGVKEDLNKLGDLDAHLQRAGGREFFKYKDADIGAIDNIVKYVSTPKGWLLRMADKLRGNQLVNAYSDILLDPNITKEMKRIGEKAVQLKGKPNKDSIELLKAESEDLWNTIIENAKLSSKISLIRRDEKSIEEEITNPFGLSY